MKRSLLAALSAALAAASAVSCKVVDDARPEPSTHATAASPAPAATGHVHVIAAPPSGDVQPIVRDQLAKETAARRRLVVYVGATWCEPCQRFHRAADHGDLDSAFPDLDLLAFDTDRDNERLASAGYVSRYIPLLALPAADGKASGRQIEGGIKGDGAVAQIVPRLRALLAQ